MAEGPDDAGELKGPASPGVLGNDLGKAARAGAAESGALPGGASAPKGEGAASAGTGRDAQGRFVRQDGAGEAPSGAQPAPDPNETAGQQPQEAAETFTFDGQTYATRAEAETAIRRDRENLKAQQRLVETLRKQKNEAIQHAREAVSAANSWQQHATAAGQAGQGKPEKSEPETPWYQDPERLDLGFARELAETKGLDAALLYMAQASDKVYTDRFSKMVDERVAPLLQERQVAQAYQGAMQTFYAVADETDASGAEAYPELRSGNPEIHKAIVEIWRDTDRELRLGEDGVRVAVMKYRRQVAEGRIQAPETTVPGPTPPPSAPSAARVVSNLQARNEAASAALTGSGTPRAAAPGTDSEAVRLKAILRQGGSTVRSKSGFDHGFTYE